MLSQKFQIVPQGYLNNGTASYSADETTGAIEADEDIDASAFFIPYELKNSANAKVDPKMFLSSSIVKGLSFQVGTVMAKVVAITPAVSATVQIDMDDEDQHIVAHGTISLDLKNKYWSISKILVNATIGNIPLLGSIDQVLEANPVA